MSRSASLWIDIADSAIRLDEAVATMSADAAQRRFTIYKITHDILLAARESGLTAAQAYQKLDEIFSTFAAEWSIYDLAGATAIVDAIQNDTTLNLLNAEYPPGSGVTIRERLVNRLSE